MTRTRTAAVTMAVALAASFSDVSLAEAPAPEKQECISAAEAGQSQRDDGHYRSARASFLACSRDACPPIIVRNCVQWLHDMDQVAPTVVLAARDEQGNDVTDAKVTLDGQPLNVPLDGKPIEADAGEHLYRFQRAGSAPAEQRVVLRAGEKARAVAVVLRSLTAAPPPPPRPQAAPARNGVSPRTVAAGGLGVAALAAAGVGIGFFLGADQAKTDAANDRAGLSSSACVNPGSLQQTCQFLNDKVNTQYSDTNLSTGLFVAAGGLAAAAVVTFLAWPDGSSTPSPETVWLSPTPGGAFLGLRGAFE